MSEPAWSIRRAEPGDVPAILDLVQALAVYEREPDAVHATEVDFHTALFGPEPRVFAHVVELLGPNGPVIAGMALWFVTFSTWTGKHGLWLEDLFVLPEHRRLGIGRALLETLAGICRNEGWSRFEWWVLDWNTPAHRFYESLGAVPLDEWTVWRTDGDALRRLGVDDGG